MAHWLMQECRDYIKKNGIDHYDANFIPRRTKEALALSKKEINTQKPKGRVEKDSNEGMSYSDLVKSFAASMKDQRQQKRAEGVA